MKLRNIKASFILEEKFTTNQRGINYIFKHLGFTFTIYNHSLFLVNVTGIKSLDHLKLAREIIELEIKINVKKVRIDNTFFSKKNYRNVDLRRVYKFMQKSRKFHVEYNVELFAGMYFKPKQKYYPTILFFRTGSFTMMGGKKMKILKECETFVNEIIETFDECSKKQSEIKQI